jgi:DNA-binding HxlR family transcriptional regulator
VIEDMPSNQWLKAVIYFSFVYVVFPFFIALMLLLSLTTTDKAVPLVASVLTLGLWFLVALQRVKYDSSTLRSIRLKEAPIRITRMLSETTNMGLLINQAIVLVLEEKSHISQTDVYEELNAEISNELLPSKEMVRQYIEKLEKEGIIRNVASEIAESKKKAYVLTNKGKWCCLAIRKYYPKYRASFILRNFIRSWFHKNLPLFESIQE